MPKISHLDDAHSERYRKVFLNKLFNYNKFVDVSALLKEDQNSGVGSPQLNTSSSASSGTSPIASPDRLNDSRDQVFEDDPYLDGMQDYTKGLELLREGDENRGKDKIRNAATKRFEPAMYAYAIIKFKEVMQGNIVKNLSGVDCDSKEAVKEAVECMINSGTFFFPLNSFILGIMELYNVGNCSKVIQTVSQKSWKMHFADVLRAKGTPIIDVIAEQSLLSLIGSANLDFTEPRDYLEIVGKAEGIKELESMVDHVKYELARDIVLHKGNYIAARSLFEELSFKVSSGGNFLYPDAQFSYAVALFIGKLTENKKEQKVYDLLSKADSCEHLEARLFLGILLFKKGYEFCKSNNHWNYLESYLNVVHDDKDIKQKYLKEKISVFIAYEYINNSSFYVRYDEQKAKDILRQDSNQNELERLVKAIEKGRECSQISNVLQTLKYVSSVFKTKGSDKLYAQRLSPMLEQLRRNLKDSKITIQQSQDLLLVLKQLNNISSPNEKDLLPLQQLYYSLEEEVGKQLDGSSREEMLSLIAELREVSIDVQKRRSNSLSSADTTNSTNTRRHSFDESMHDVFEYPLTPSSKIKEITMPLSSNQTSLPRARASSTAINFEDNSGLESFVNASEFFVDLPSASTVLNKRDSIAFESSRRLSLFVHDIPDDGKLLGKCFNIAAELCKKGEYQSALETYEEVFDRRKSVLGYNHYGTIMTRHNMAVLFYTLGESQQALGIFKEMLNKLGPSHHYAASIKHNIGVVSQKKRKELFVQPGEEQREPFSKSVSNNFQNVPIVDKGKSSYSSSLSLSSGFESGLSAFSGQSISERGELPSSVFSRIKQEQSSGSSQQNVSEAAGLDNGGRSVERLSSLSSTRGGSTSEFSRSSSRTSKSVSDEFSATGMSSLHKYTSKAQEAKKKNTGSSRSSSRPSTNMGNLQTEKHTASSKSIGKR